LQSQFTRHSGGAGLYVWLMHTPLPLLTSGMAPQVPRAFLQASPADAAAPAPSPVDAIECHVGANLGV
jgi:hypothetical protein